MDFSAFLDALKTFDNKRILQYLGENNLGELSSNPWFLGTMGALALIALLCKWRTLLAIIVGFTGLVWVFSYSIKQGTELGGEGNFNVVFFAGGAVLVIFVMMYLLFIRHD